MIDARFPESCVYYISRASEQQVKLDTSLGSRSFRELKVYKMNSGFDFSKRLPALFACAVLLFTACEKHDGESYFKTKCVAELNGQTYYDQAPLKYALSPAFIKSPSFDFYEDETIFWTNLSEERGGKVIYYVSVRVFSDIDDIIGKEQVIKKVGIDYPSEVPSYSYYLEYCEDNDIPLAEINGEIVDEGTFRVMSYDAENEEYHGTFTLRFSEGTMEGEFWI